MTAATQPAPTSPAGAGRRVTQARVVRAEWTKFRSQPSAGWSLLTAVALIVGFGVLYSLVRVTRPPRTPAELASFDPTAIGLAGAQLAQVAVRVLGCCWSPASTPPAWSGPPWSRSRGGCRCCGPRRSCSP